MRRGPTPPQLNWQYFTHELSDRDEEKSEFVEISSLGLLLLSLVRDRLVLSLIAGAPLSLLLEDAKGEPELDMITVLLRRPAIDIGLDWINIMCSLRMK